MRDKTNFIAYLNKTLKNDYGKADREVEEKNHEIVQKEKDHIQEKEDQEKRLKQKAWNYFLSLPKTERFKINSNTEEKMKGALKFVESQVQRDGIIKTQIEKDLIQHLEIEKKV